jgi:hypothetical protein
MKRLKYPLSSILPRAHYISTLSLQFTLFIKSNSKLLIVWEYRNTMQHPDSNYWYAGITSQYTSTIGPQYSESSNTEHDSNGNTPTTLTSYSGFSSSGLYSPQYSGVQNDYYADANVVTAFEGALTSRPTFYSLGWTMNSPNVRLYSFRVPKCKEPYFELKSPFTPTTETPRKIYLDEAKYVRRKCRCYEY